MVQAHRILVVEDEQDLADLLAYNLKKAGFLPQILHDGVSAVQTARAAPPDLIILDVMLPGLNGVEVARQLRTDPRCRQVPIVMLTARAEEADQLAGLSVGADDYVTKPFSMKVLLARVTALLRRTSGEGEQGASVRVGPVVADLAAHTVMVDGAEARLTLTEYKLLVAMMQARRRVLSRNDLIARVLGPGIVVTARTIDVHVASLRRKLGVAGSMIRTIRGVGYQFVEEHPSPGDARSGTAGG